jgi:hypothetical protein
MYVRFGPSQGPSPDNDKRANYITTTGSSVFGAFPSVPLGSCATGIEIVGQVTPANYEGRITLLREILPGGGIYKNSISMPISGPLSPGPDTSDPDYLDDDPRPNGRVYDLDAPGMGASGSDIWRTRTNFRQWAVLGGRSSTKKVSDYLHWYGRESCKVASGNLALSWDLPVERGDNQAYAGTTPTSWDLQD